MIKTDFFAEVNSDEIINPITPEKIHLVEEKYNIKLPGSYINFLHYQNGGYINYKIIPEWKENIEIEFISGIQGNEKFKGIDVLEESNYYKSEWNLPEKALLLSGNGHWWVFLDYRKLNSKNEPSISYFDSEKNIDTIIADSFEDLINKLQKA